MSLKINQFTSNLSKLVIFSLSVLAVACLIKVAVWEHNYYLNKEGSARATVSSEDYDEEELAEIDENEVSPNQVARYSVSPDKPRYLSIEKLGISNARVKEVGLTKQNKMGTLANIYDVGWYRQSAAPGSGKTILVNGHNGGPTKDGVFKHLDTLSEGDIITLERGDGQIFEYIIHEAKQLPIQEATSYMPAMQTSPIEGAESLSLITCSGDWSQLARTYMSRTMIRAVIKQ